MDRTIVFVRLSDVRPNRWNPNSMTDEEFAALRESIHSTNYLEKNPIRVRPLEGGAGYEIVDGEHRWMACKELGLSEVPCVVMDVPVEQAMVLSVIYNKDRGSIDPYKMGKLLSVYYKPYSHGVNQEELARRFGYSQQRISDFLKAYEVFRDVPEENLPAAGKSGAVLEEVATVKEPAFREALLEAITEGDSRGLVRAKAKELNKAAEIIEASISDPEKRRQVIQELASPELIQRGNTASVARRKVAVLLSGEASLPQVEGLIWGNCVEEMKKLPEGSVDLILTDPPFFIGEEMEAHRGSNPMKYDPAVEEVNRELRDFDAFTSEEEYLEFTGEWLGQAARILKPCGHLVTFTDRLKVTDLVRRAESLGLQTRQPLFWVVSNPVPMAGKIGFADAVMEMLWFTKANDGKHEITFNYQLSRDAGGKLFLQPNWFPAPYVSGGERTVHPSQKPLFLLEKLIGYLSNPGDTVLDPFAGSGSTLVAAVNQKRRALGIEKNELFYRIAVERLAKAQENTTTAANTRVK